MNIEFEKLILSHHSSLKKLAFQFTKNPTDAEDLLQSTIEKMVKGEASFQMNTNFKAWANTVMRNLFIGEYRKKRRQRELAKQTDRKILSSFKDTVENTGDQNINLAFLNNAISKLVEPNKTPFQMFIDGFHYQEIADTLHLPIGTIKSRIYAARQILKSQLKEIRA